MSAVVGRGSIRGGRAMVRFVGSAAWRLIAWGMFLSCAWFVVTFLYVPNIGVLREVIFPSSGDPLATAVELFSSARVLAAIRDTLIVTAVSLVTVSAVGITQAFILEAFCIRGKGFLTVAYAIPLVFGSVAAVTGYVMVYGAGGPITIGLQRLLPGLPDDWFSGIPAVILVHTFTMTGYHFLFLRPAIRRIDFSMVEAARSLGMSPVPAFVRVVLPVLRPMIVASLLMVLIGSLGSFAAPNILGGGSFTMVGPLIRTLTSLGRPDMAALLGVLLALATVGLLAWALRAERRASLFSAAKSTRPFQPIRVGNPIGRATLYAVAYALALVNMLPVLVTVLMAFSPVEAIRNGQLWGGLTLDNFATVFGDSGAVAPLVNSLLLCVIAIPLALTIGTALSHFVDRHRGAATDALQMTFFLPYFLPGVLIALGFLIVFGAPHVLTGGHVLVGSFWILLLAYVVILLPTVVRFVRAALAGVDPALDEAARALGARSPRRFALITLPMLVPVLVQVAALSFNATFDEYTVSVMLYNVNNRPLGVAMGALAATPDPELVGVATAYVVLNTVIALGVVLFADRMAAWQSRRVVGAMGGAR
ncbi:ABC transporter permease [Microbacterium esteraromaticum]|uniref:ABC transporter permease n=1 Tax=Microbacterium esteraromaticum TaxID=57043 RepID=UPI003C304174